MHGRDIRMLQRIWCAVHICSAYRASKDHLQNLLRVEEGVYHARPRCSACMHCCCSNNSELPKHVDDTLLSKSSVWQHRGRTPPPAASAPCSVGRRDRQQILGSDLESDHTIYTRPIEKGGFPVCSGFGSGGPNHSELLVDVW